MRYTQNDEQDVIVGHFGERTGRVLDIGAFDGRWCSNSYELIKRGWSAVCVEPAPIPFAHLLKLHWKNPNVKCVQALIGQTSGLTRFLENFGDALSSTDAKWPTFWKGHPFREMWAVTVSARDLLNQFGSHFDFVTIDVEGCNLDVLKSLPLVSEMDTELVCVEYEYSQPAKHIEYLQSTGWRVIHRTPQNLIARRA